MGCPDLWDSLRLYLRRKTLKIIANVRLLGLDYIDTIHWILCHSLVVHTINSDRYYNMAYLV